MWNSCKSVYLSSICTKAVIILVIGFIIFASNIVSSYVDYTDKNPEIIIPLIITVYACCVPALIALLCLDRLLSNIKKEEVFIYKNVKYLRLISWCCFAVSIIFVISGFYYILFVMMAIVAAFFGLILRVVKNVIEQAIIIKDDYDYTI